MQGGPFARSTAEDGRAAASLAVKLQASPQHQLMDGPHLIAAEDDGKD